MKTALDKQTHVAGIRLKLGLALMTIVVIGGTLGFHFIEHWTFLDCLYMTAITISTVGFGEVHPLSPAGKTFTIFLLLGGVGTMAFAASMMVETIVHRQVRLLTGRRGMQKDISKLTHHIIICGYGRMGRLVAENLAASKHDFVIVENDPEVIEEAVERGLMTIHGNATDEEFLEKAGINRASAVVAALSSDADNLFLTLTARGMNKELGVIVRANDQDSVRKFHLAGATRVVLPDVVGADHITRLLTRPSVVDFVELVAKDGGIELEVRQIEIAADSPFANKTLAEARIRQATGCIVLAIRRPDKKTLFDPGPEALIQAGDTLLAVGSCEPANGA
ncbi:MAG: potassium channel protein [bacterium]